MTASHQVMAQAYPNKPLRMVVTAAAGGITDIMTRIMSENIQRSIGQPMMSRTGRVPGGEHCGAVCRQICAGWLYLGDRQ
ncbi:MAG: hypothetical protein ACKVQK_22825 [Burkholderiales bacterium]